MLHRATPADIGVMAAIHATAFTPPDAWSRDVFGIHLGLPGVFGLLHPSGGMILMRVASDQAEILTIAVTPEARRAGIATSLLSEATARAAAMGATAIFLEVSVVNIAALALYSRAGFIQVGRRPHYYSDNTDALVMRFDPPGGA
jgi:ribosomal-protein-alanine N-acetyltransferase